MSRSRKRLVFGGLILLAILAILNPGYSSVYVEGPNGVIKTERFKFGPGGLFVCTRVTADESSVQIEQP
jgi:hypothetical protein